MLPQIKVPEIHTPQWGIPGSVSPLGVLTASGNVIYLGTTVGKVVASDANDGLLPTFPKATLSGALAACTAGQGDVVVVLPGRYDFAAALTWSKSNVRILGWSYLLGMNVGDSIFDGNGGNILDVTASIVEIAGIQFESIEDATNFCVRAGNGANITDVNIHHCSFRVGQYGIILGVGANTASRVRIYANEFKQINNTAANAAISIVVGSEIAITGNLFWSNIALAAYGVGIANVATPGLIISDNHFVFQQAGTGVFRAGTNVDASIHNNLFSGAGTPVTVLVDGGDHAVMNYSATNAGGALVDATT